MPSFRDGVERRPQRSRPRGALDDSELNGVEDAIGGLRLLTKKGSKPDPAAAEAVRVFRETLNRLKSQIGGEEDVDFRSDVGTKVILRAMLATTLELIPTAAEKYTTEKNESAAYAFSSLLNQSKDLMSQLRSMDSLDEQADHISDNILVRANMATGQNLISGLMQMKTRIRESQASLADKSDLCSAMDGMVREHVKFLDEQLKSTTEQIRAYLLGEAPKLPAPRRTKRA